MSISLSVVAGRNRLAVGSIQARVGMLTSAGRITRVTEHTLYFENGSRRRNVAGVTVRHSEAFSFGYPFASGCLRNRVRVISRAGERIAA